MDPALALLMYLVMPLWLAAGFADWSCHRASHIETTGGVRESAIHLLMFAEVGAPLLAALLLEVDALVIGLGLLAFALHEATALWDVSYATSVRRVSPLEQHVHSFLEMIPLLGLLLIVVRHPGQALALFGLGEQRADFALAWKTPPLPAGYLTAVFAGVILFALLPYLEELHRGWRARRRSPRADAAFSVRPRLHR